MNRARFCQERMQFCPYRLPRNFFYIFWRKIYRKCPSPSWLTCEALLVGLIRDLKNDQNHFVGPKSVSCLSVKGEQRSSRRNRRRQWQRSWNNWNLTLLIDFVKIISWNTFLPSFQIQINWNCFSPFFFSQEGSSGGHAAMQLSRYFGSFRGKYVLIGVGYILIHPQTQWLLQFWMTSGSRKTTL